MTDDLRRKAEEWAHNHVCSGPPSSISGEVMVEKCIAAFAAGAAETAIKLDSPWMMALSDYVAETVKQLQAECLCGGCVRLRGGGQHHNGPCAVDSFRWVHPDGSSKQAWLRRLAEELTAILARQGVQS